jgi:predicted metal-binding membrane protein
MALPPSAASREGGAAAQRPGRWAASERVFLVACGLVFLAAAALTVGESGSPCCRERSMPGGWSLCLAWLREPGQSWLEAAGAFLGMWMLMMVAMMLPCLVPMLSRYRAWLRESSGGRLGGHTFLAATGYFLPWAAFGAVLYPLGVAFAGAVLRWPALSRSMPAVFGAALVLAGALQFTAWKSGQIRRCRERPTCGGSPPREGLGQALRHGVWLGWHCCQTCFGLIVVLLVLGMMDLWAMALITAAMAFERSAPRPDRAARAIGALIIAAGAWTFIRALATAVRAA